MATQADDRGPQVHSFAPGRVNLMGDHTDHAGGLALPVAIDLGTAVRARRGGTRVRLRSVDLPGVVHVGIAPTPPWPADPPWARYVGAVVAEVAPSIGLDGVVTTTLPVGAGLSSSAALEVSLALALDAPHAPVDLARLARRAEHRAVGVPSGLMDQLTSTCGVRGAALLIDFSTETHRAVPLPSDVDLVVVHSGEARALAGSPYGRRREEVGRAIRELGPLRARPVDDARELRDPVLRRRARHVIGENRRVLEVAAALERGDRRAVGTLMVESHTSLRDDMEVSTTELDRTVDAVLAVDGVHGARLTGAGFGGCVVAIAEPDAIGDPAMITGRGWRVRASDGARVLSG